MTRHYFVIFSAEEAAADIGWDAGGFWSNEQGWGHLSTATVFTIEETRAFNLDGMHPVDVEWITLPKHKEQDSE